MNSKRSIGILSLLLLLVGALSFVPAAAIHATGYASPMSPRLMLTDYSVKGAALSVGESGTLQLTVKNMHPDEEVRNVKLSLDAADGPVIPEATGSTFVERIPAAQEVVWDCTIQALSSSAPGVYPLTLTIEYEDVQGTALSSNETVYIEVTQVPRLEFGHLTMSPRVQQGEMAQLSLNVMNLGKGPVHNVLLTLSMDGLADGFSELVGQLESGESRQASMNIPVSQSVEPGTVEGTLQLSYESPAGELYEESFELSTVVVEREDLDPLAEDAGADDGLIPRWWLIPAGAAVTVLLVLYIIQGQRLRRIKEEEAARL